MRVGYSAAAFSQCALHRSTGTSVTPPRERITSSTRRFAGANCRLMPATSWAALMARSMLDALTRTAAFAAPTAIGDDIRRQYEVKAIGPLDGIHEAFYAITVERRLRHPAVVAISEAARERLFA